MYFVLSVLICEGSIKSYKLQQKINSIQHECVHIEIHTISYFEPYEKDLVASILKFTKLHL